MSEPNVNVKTGIRFGAIAGDSLDPELLDALYLKVSAKVYDALRSDREKELRQYIQAECSYLADDNEALIEVVERELEFESEAGEFGSDEPSAEIEHDGVQLQFGYLGGAVLILVLQSPVVAHVRSLCSPSVPNAGDLDSGAPLLDDGYTCYGVPESWLREENPHA